MEKKLGRLGVSIEHSESRRAGNEMLQNYEETRRNKNIEETRMKLTLPNSLIFMNKAELKSRNISVNLYHED